MLERLKNTYKKLLFGNQHSVNHLIKTMLADPTNTSEKIFLKARYNYLSKNKYNRDISQGERIMLSNILVHNYENTMRELPHFIYHTLENKGRLQILPDENIFNTRYYKCGDFVIHNNQLSIEAKTFKDLSLNNLTDLVNQYKDNKRNKSFIFSIFYNNNINLTEFVALDYVSNNLEIDSSQIIIKSLKEVLDSFTDEKIEQVINYYNISFLEYQLNMNILLKQNLENILLLKEIKREERKQIKFYLNMLNNKSLTKKQERSKKSIYPYKDTTKFLDNDNVDPIDEDQLSPEDYMSDVHGWMFKEDE